MCIRDSYTALLGGDQLVDTLDGQVKLKVKPETQNGTKVRLKGKGLSLIHIFAGGFVQFHGSQFHIVHPVVLFVNVEMCIRDSLYTGKPLPFRRTLVPFWVSGFTFSFT